MEQPKSAQPVAPARPAHRAWTLYLMKVAGIPIYLHFTFILLLVIVAFIDISDISQNAKWFGRVLYVLAIFTSVALHELGHALMARRFGIKTDDIVLYPIGGVARLRSMGEGFQEFWIAIAGPLVNVAIVLIIYTALVTTGRWVSVIDLYHRFQLAEQANNDALMPLVGFWQSVLFANVMLFVFNLIPAFPMDGGRVLRAILSRRLPKERATAIAAKVGQGLAVAFMLLGAMGHQYILMIIGFFVFWAAGQESAATRSAALMAGRKIRDAMITHFETLAHGDSLGRAADLLLQTTQQDFPVMGGAELLGVLGRRALVQGLATVGRDHYVAEVMDREFPRVRPEDDLHRAFELMRENQGAPIMVFDGNRFVGFVNNENLMEYLLIAQTRNNH